MRKFILTLLILGVCSTASAADHYWIGSVDTSWGTAGNWSATSGGASNGTTPGSTDDVYLDANSGAGSVVTDDVRYCAKFDCTGFTGTLDLSWNDVLYVYGDCTLASGMTITQAASGGEFAFGSTANQSFTTNGCDVPRIIYVNKTGGTITLQDTMDIAGQLYIERGTFDCNDQTVTMGSFRNDRWYGASFVMGTGTITLSTGSFAMSTGNGGITCETSTLVMEAGNIASHDLTFYDVTFTGSGTRYISGINTIHDLSVTGSAAKTDAFYFSGNNTVTNADFDGNSASNRLLVYSNTLGTARTITAATVSVSNADFRDITGAGAASWDLSGATGGSGDCGGNTDITFTTADDLYWWADGGNWSTTGNWYTATDGGGTNPGWAPLPQDTAYFDANSFDNGSQTITQDMPRIGSIDWTGATDSPTFDISNGLDQQCYGSLTLISAMTISGYYADEWHWYGRGANTFTSATHSLVARFGMYGVGGSITFQDNYTTGDPTDLYAVYGTVDLNDFDVTWYSFNSNYGNTRAVSMGSGTCTIVKPSAFVWDTRNTSNFTFNAETSTVVIAPTGTGATVHILTNGLTFYNFTVGAGGGTNNISLGYANTFNVFTIIAPNTVWFDSGKTQTMNSFIAVGTVSDGIVISSEDAAAHTLSDTAGTNAVEYCTISYSEAGGGATWNALVGCTDSGNNTGWVFPAAGGNPQVIIIITKLCERITDTWKMI